MRAITALEVRAQFGRVLDEAAAGERFVVERAGVPVAAIVPLRDLDATDPERVRADRLAALDRLQLARALDRGSRPTTAEIVERIREDRDRDAG